MKMITKTLSLVGSHLAKGLLAVRSFIRLASYNSALEQLKVYFSKEYLADSVLVERAI